MARKAVQGFPEKSYYDNTRYLGIVATTDPLNEGLFKHMVNFDISDTGQSVQPREGFLTTTLKNINHISLSNNTIIYKDSTLGDYILFDITNNVGYIADVSGYNVQNYYLPIKSVIANKNWNDLFLYVLIPQVNYVRNFYNANTTQNKLTDTIAHFIPFIKPITDTKIEHIYDENGISRTLVKVKLNTGIQGQLPFDFIIQFRYRENAVGPFAADTLIIEGLRYMFEHPTLAPTERNIAVAKSIIPETFQRLYTKPLNVDANSIDPRPDGHISNLGTFVYIYDNNNNYVNNFIFRNSDYNIKPYFSLNPAYIDLNNNPEATDKWAYKFELFNTSTEISDRTKNVLFSSPWMKYQGDSIQPTPIFLDTVPTSNRDTVISLGNTETLNNHYLGSKYIIFIVPKEFTTTKSTIVNGTETVSSGKINGDFFDEQGIVYATLLNRYNAWSNAITSVKDLRTLRTAINNLSNIANFYLYDLTQEPSASTFKNFDESMKSLLESGTDTHAIVSTVDEEYDLFLTASELLKRIEDENIFNTNYNIVFKFLPFASKDTITVTNTIDAFTSDPRFLTQAPYYVSGNPEGSLTTIVNARVQDRVTGKFYRQTASPEGSTYEEINFTEGNFPTLGFSEAQVFFGITTGSNEVIGTFDNKNICTGLLVTGTGIPADTYILYKKNDTTVVISNAATATNAGVALTMTVPSGGLVFNFTKDLYYTDTRTQRFFQWRNESTTIGLLTSTANPGANKEEYRWFFGTIKYWGGSTQFLSAYPNYIMKKNNFFNNRFGFFRQNLETGKFSLETNLNILKNQGLPAINFTTSNLFGSQAPYYYNGGTNSTAYWVTQSGDEAPWIGNPGTPLDPNIQADEWYLTNFFVAPINTIVQYSDQEGSYFYKNIGNNLWSFLGVDTNQQVSWVSNPIEGRVYQDLRTQTYYQWLNPTGINGQFTSTTLNGVVDLVGPNFFDKGINGIFYMRPYEDDELLNESGQNKTFEELQTLQVAWGASSFRQTFNVSYGFDSLTVTYIDQVLDLYPQQIQASNTMTVFEDSRLLLWYNNVLFISEEGRFYWFKERNRIEFSEEIVKVLQYKQLILVFTTQHLYAVYRVETTTTQLNTATNQIEQNVTGVAWLKQIVLYNLLVSKKYADVIQIFNQMVLFYSEDGQLFMIRPSNTIDDQTRFNIQLFNKAANDILEHYDEYINERLATYAKDTRVTKDQVQIKSLVSINFIKIIYYVPNVITYILVYDVINNRYYAYDTLTFTNIFDKRFIDSGDLLITEHNNKLFFTIPFTEPNIRDNHVDMTFTNNFKKESVNCLIDTGNLNLNNHIHKRFRDLHVTFKNLNASDVLFNLETMIDEIIVRPFYSEQLEVQEIGGAMYLVTVPKFDNNDLVNINNISETATDVIKYSLTNNLFETNNVLMDFSQYTSSKLLTHRTSILGLGKVFRIKLQFISKGLYKLQNFGIIYKERRV